MRTPGSTTWSPRKGPSRATGPRADNEYRDLGLAAASGGRIGAKHIRAIRPFEQPTGWHWHDMTGHFRGDPEGWITFRFAGVEGDVTVKEGSCLSQPAGVAHNVIARSDDLELIEINLPAEYGTKDLWRREGRGAAVTIAAAAPPATRAPPRASARGCGAARAADRVRAPVRAVGSAVHLTGIKEYLLPPPSKVWAEFSSAIRP
jgi:hypothetical protein